MIGFSSKFLLSIISLYCYFIDFQSKNTGIYAIEVATQIPNNLKDILNKTNGSEIRQIMNNTRRIILGHESTLGRPYMVYLKLPRNNPRYQDYYKWLCGGVIIHEEYILTSAACIEDVKHFYIVSGTYIHDEKFDRYNNPCIKNGARKAIWKCVPRNYNFDGHENDNIRWMNNDIAIVRIEEEFDFTRRIRGCDYIPQPICYNNRSANLEEPGTEGYIAGWGTTQVYNQNTETTKSELLETVVHIIPKSLCKKRWGKRYHNIIDNYMICSKDIIPELSERCSEKYTDCMDISYESDEVSRRVINPENLELHSAYHNTTRRTFFSNGGFCENDHGGPLIYGGGESGQPETVIGIISACLIKETNNKCYGPFLYTSVWKNRFLINCAIFKSPDGRCNKVFRDGTTHVEEVLSWVDHPDGPAKTELKVLATNKTIKPIEPKLNNDTPIEELNENTAVSVIGATLRTSNNTTRRDINKTDTSAIEGELTVNRTEERISSIISTLRPKP